MNGHRILFGAVLVIALVAQTAWAASPLGTAFTYQGRLKQNGSAVNGTAELKFSLWDDPVAGTRLGAVQTINGVPVNNGVFTVELNAGGEFGPDAFNGQARWLQIGVNGFPLSPRQPIDASPHALYARSVPWSGLIGVPAGFADGVDNSGDPIWGNSGSDIFYVAGDVGVGTSGPLARLHTVSADGATHALLARHTMTTGATPAIEGITDSSDLFSAGILGRLASSSPGDFSAGVIGVSDSTTFRGIGVWGIHYQAGIGVYGTSGPGGYGVYGAAIGVGVGANGIGAGSRGVDAVGDTGIKGTSNHAGIGGVGVLGVAGTANVGVRGESSSGGATSIGVVGESTDPSGTGVRGIGPVGVVGTSTSATGTGVLAISETGNGLEAVTNSGTTEYAAIYAHSTLGLGLKVRTVYSTAINATSDAGVAIGATTGSASGSAIVATASGGTGVYGSSQNGNGVEGFSPSGTGVKGRGTSGRGVWGESFSHQGVYGHSDSQAGVVGVSESSVGVWGESNNFDAAGVAGDNKWAGGLAGWFGGNVTVTGSISKAGGSFKIDHPLDPANKYLSHSFVESPDMMNIYNGNITTDERGYATITLPDWFEALNREFRYQLTVLDETDGDDFVQAKIVKKIRGNRFTVRTSRPNVEVSWLVTGVRQDVWAHAHRIVVEEPKPESERGKYRHPELYGQPREMGIGHRSERTRPPVPNSRGE